MYSLEHARKRVISSTMHVLCNMLCSIMPTSKPLEIGEKFFSWTVLGEFEEGEYVNGIRDPTIYVNLQCECGNVKKFKLDGPGPGVRFPSRSRIEHDCGCGIGYGRGSLGIHGRPKTPQRLAQEEIIVVPISPKGPKMRVAERRQLRSITMTPSLISEVDKWATTKNIGSWSRAIEVLVVIGLGADEWIFDSSQVST